MLINPSTYQVIRRCPLNKGRLTCDQLKENLRFVRELASYEGSDLHEAFARFSNDDVIIPLGWYETDELTFTELDEYYFGNTQ